jgi:hypothetical protein
VGKATSLGGLGFSHFAAEKPQGSCGQAAGKILLRQAQDSRDGSDFRPQIKSGQDRNREGSVKAARLKSNVAR